MAKKQEPEVVLPDLDKPIRVGIIDLIRTVCLLSSIALLFLRQFNRSTGGFLFSAEKIETLQIILAVPVVLISGISCYFSRDNLKRGVFLLAAGWVVSFATEWLTPEQPVRFGILTLLGVSCILFYFAGAAIEKMPVLLGFALFTFLIAVTVPVSAGYLGVTFFYTIDLPAALTERLVFLPFGFSPGGIDDFPLLPWLFLFLLGTVIGRWRQGRWNGIFVRLGAKTAWISRLALPIFLLAQPIIYGIGLLLLHH